MKLPLPGRRGFPQSPRTGSRRATCTRKSSDCRGPALEQLRGGDAATNARLLLSVLEGERSPYRDVVLANAAAAFTLAGKAQNFMEGTKRAAEAIDSGAARAKLRALVEFTQRRRS